MQEIEKETSCFCWTTGRNPVCFKLVAALVVGHPGAIHALLEIEGAGGKNVPYLGYVLTLITFPKNISGKEQLVVLILFVPECHFNSKILLLIGTNVLLRVYRQLLLGMDRSTIQYRSDPDLNYWIGYRGEKKL